MMQPKVSIWHNKNCSTSRKGLALIQEHFDEVSIRNYISEPPSIAELQNVLQMMHEPATYILRKKDKVYQELFVGQELSNDAWIKAMHEHPSMIERPIIIIGNKAYLARPFDLFAAKLKALYP